MKYLWKKATASFLALIMLVGMVPTASAARADISETVEAGEKVVLGTSDFADFFEEDSLDSPYYLEFDNYDDFDDYGYFTAKNAEGKVVKLYDSTLDNGEFYFKDRHAEGTGEYRLSSLTFVADEDADEDSFDLEFTVYGDEDDEASGTLRITVDGGSSKSSADITLEVEAGEDASFNEEDFYDLFDEEFGDGDDADYLEYIKFTEAKDLDEYGALYAYDNEDEDEFQIEEDEIDDYTFYYDSTDDEDLLIEDLTYYAAAKADGKKAVLEFTMVGEDRANKLDGTLTIEIGKSSGSSSSTSSVPDGDIVYEVDPGDEYDFDEDDFEDFFLDKYDDYDFKHVRFTAAENLSSSNGYIYYDYDGDDEVRFSLSTLKKGYFFYDEDDVEDDTDYALEDLTFAADKDFDSYVSVDFTAVGSSNKKVSGTLIIVSSELEEEDNDNSKGDLNYSLDANDELEFDPDDFNDFFQEKYDDYDFEYLEFTDVENLSSFTGYLYYDFGRADEERFTVNDLDDARFYYDDDHDDIDEDEGYYALEDISFVSSAYFASPVILNFTAYYSSTKKVDGTVIISPKAGESTSAPSASNYVGNIRYSTTGTNVQINANDIARFFSKSFPGQTMQYVMLSGTPATGSLYYNYYGTSKYGTAARTQLTAYSAASYKFYASPTATNQYALTELTYVPSGRNYCTAIPFVAYGTSGRSVSGAILISVTSKAVPEVYGVTLKNTAYNFPASSVYSAVANATGSALSSIQLLSLPAATAGTLYVGSGLTRATTSSRYTYAAGSYQMSSLRFVPASGFTGNVEIPYVALNAAGTAIGSGVFSLGVVNTVKKFSDMPSSTWCYKYVTELSAANVIAGYNDGTFKPNSTITYGAALKLITLAAGHGEKAPTGSHTFSGYLSYAQQKGWITRSNVNLSGTITRQQMAQLAAAALGLNTTSLSSVKPFTDTTDAAVQALNAAGIIEGYFANGTSTFKPNNTLTRGQMSAIVWRMQNMK